MDASGAYGHWFDRCASSEEQEHTDQETEECRGANSSYPPHVRNSLERTANWPRNPVSLLTMLRQILLNSTDNPNFDVIMTQSSTHAHSSLNTSHSGGSVSVDSLLRPTAARGGSGGGGLREGELHKPDLVTYIVMCLLLFLLVLLIVFFINCQLRNSFFASMPYDRSLREARTSYK